ncbi:class I adenylate-forming enzyme family protein [Arenicella xantha]|uniref:Acyl-CoA synthetase (AMP-forming)/AMP-acid ligase II n=1 Tax=Arenicella xantha TaxID=644221 RepID=A0A395JM19_9GAMM|nr:class I adenylate-forming enzyme family protein [Arenicella xantha]RBP51751.1 acyl-CoA synthetase (AMP-forming)/AMP-acid ligase II [Arenicella xantha]
MNHFQAKSPLLPEILALHGKWRAQQDAVICHNQRLTWRQFTETYHQFAHGMLAQGVQPADKVGIIMSNGIPMLSALMGCMAAGLVSVPINLSVNDDALLGMLSDAKVTAIVVSHDQQQRIEALAGQLPTSILIKVCDSPTNQPWVAWQDLLYDQPTTLPDVTIDDTSELNIIYSSGTTGLPKGIVHNHAGRRDWAYDLAIALRYHCNSKTLLTLGLYSNISWVAMLTTLLAGGTLVIHQQFNVVQFLTTVATESITHTAMVPIQFQRILEQLEANTNKWDLSSMQAMMSCGSPLHAELKQRIFKHFDCGIIELYGLTEGVITTIEPEQSEGRWSSVGKPLIGTDIRIVNEDNQELDANQSGEIVSRGRITMPGYLNRPDANQDASYTDPQGKLWLRTGDIGYFDEEGFLYIVDRKKDMILSGSQNIYPQDIEAVLIEHGDVNDVAVIAASSERWGETPIALIVPNNPNSVNQQSLLQWANSCLGKQQRIADVIFVEELPRNPNGKVLKRELRNTFATKQYP